MKQSGFSLIELLIVVGIIGVLSVIAIPQYQKYKAKARQGEARLSLSTLYTMEKVFITNYGYGTANFSQIGFIPKGKYHYSAGWHNRQRVGVPINVNVKLPLPRPSLNPPFTGPLANDKKANMFNACKSPARLNRNPDCFLVLENPLYPPQQVSRADSGLATDRTVRIDNTGYRNVKFLIGAQNMNGDKWIITENKRLINY